MGWSTRQLAELSATTVKAIRHYHHVDLLDEPERASNGYKQYGIPHLIRVLEITRMKELGVSLAQIRSMGEMNEDPEARIWALDADLAATVERLQRIRSELATVLRYRVPIDTPVLFQSVGNSLSERDRGLITVLSRVFDNDALDDVRELLSESNKTNEHFDNLAEDADDEAIQELARDLKVDMERQLARFPWMADSLAAAPRGKAFAEMALGTAIFELFNPAQLKALATAVVMLEKQNLTSPVPADELSHGSAPKSPT